MRACMVVTPGSILHARGLGCLPGCLWRRILRRQGIYDVDAFRQALGGCFPENRILSHDLIEGCYARSGLLSDVMVYEDFPARYSADVKPPPPLDTR